jgi:N-acetylneuraminic acid mutarotase
MIVWGGYFYDGNDHFLDTGAKYDPSTNSWTPVSTINAPTGRDAAKSVWTGNEMIVWGGYGNAGYLNTGRKYSPASNSWNNISTTNVPSARAGHSGVWTGNEMIVWGGYFYDGSDHFFNTGGRYNPNTNEWTVTDRINAPAARTVHTAVWTGNEMIIWGGQLFVNTSTSTGGIYCAQSGPTPTPSPTLTPTPCVGRCGPTPRPRPSPHVRPSP